MRDQTSEIFPTVLLPTQDLASTDTTTLSINVAEFEALTLIVQNGTLTGADGSNFATITIQENEDGTTSSGFADIDSTDQIGGAWTVKNTTAAAIQYRGFKRSDVTMDWIRVKIDFTGSGISAGYWSVIAVPGIYHTSPASAPTTDTPA